MRAPSTNWNRAADDAVLRRLPAVGALVEGRLHGGDAIGQRIEASIRRTSRKSTTVFPQIAKHVGQGNHFGAWAGHAGAVRAEGERTIPSTISGMIQFVLAARIHAGERIPRGMAGEERSRRRNACRLLRPCLLHLPFAFVYPLLPDPHWAVVIASINTCISDRSRSAECGAARSSCRNRMRGTLRRSIS